MTRPRRNENGQPRDLALDGLERVLGLQLGRASSILIDKLEPRLKHLQATPKQIAILWLAQANPGLTQAELARFFALERATVHQFTKSLARAGLITIEPCPDDGRSMRLGLSDLGRKVLAQARTIIAAHEAEATVGLTAAELARLFALLGKLRMGAG